MCGILGSVNIKSTGEYLSSIRHRGPDDSGSKSFEVNENNVQLLHTRLSILDLTDAGKQPMLSHSNISCIVFNGEIYNHEDLKKKLNNTKFSGHSDTETIVNYFDEFGIENALKDLNGIFAFAYLDLQKELLYLARDRYGVKPLYYSFFNNQLIFSSELKPIKQHHFPTIDTTSVLSCLRLRFTASPNTIYKNIYKVEPGQLLTFDLKQKVLLRKSYFVPVPKSLGSTKGEYSKLVQKYGDLFEQAVERQLMSDVEVGILLSGGIDSALVAAIAKQKSKQPVKSFTIGFKGEHSIDEIEYAKETAAILGLKHYIKKIDSSDFLNYIKQIVDIVEEPIGTTSIIPMYFLSKLASSQVKVVLSGQGADEPLGGYKKYKALPLLEKSRLFQPLLKLTKNAEFFYNKNEKLRRFLCSMQSADNVASLIEFNAIFSTKEIKDLFAHSNSKTEISSLLAQEKAFSKIWNERRPAEASIQNLFLYYDLRTSLADDLLMYTDKITMHFSLECRVPILDNDLVDFVESLPSTYKFNSKRGKIIHKDFAKEYLPSSIIERKKLGFQSPTEVWFKENKNEIQELLNSDDNFNKMFNTTEINKMLSDHSRGKNMEKQIFLFLSIFYIMKNNAENKRNGIHLQELQQIR